MPFKSKAQMRLLFATKPEVAKEFADHTSKKQMKSLPEHIKDKNGLKKISQKHRRKKDG